MTVVAAIAATMHVSCVEPALYPNEGLCGVERLKYSIAYGDDATQAYARGFAAGVNSEQVLKNCPSCGGYGYYNAAPGLPKILNPRNIDRSKQYIVSECSRCRGLGVVAESKYVPATALPKMPVYAEPTPIKTPDQEAAEVAAKKEKARKVKEKKEKDLLNELESLY